MRTDDDTEFKVLASLSGEPPESFFALPQWYEIVAQHGLETGWRARLYADDDLRAALVCAVPASGGAREIRGCCNAYSCEYGFLTAGPAADSGPAIRRLTAEIARENPRTEAILLPGLDPRGAGFAAALAGFKDAGFVAKPYFAWGTWFEPAKGKNFDAYLAGRPSVLKNTWRRKSSALEKACRVNFRTIGEVEQFIRDYDEVYQRSWKTPEPFPDFMPALLRMAAGMGALRFGVLEADERPVAAQFWLVWRGRAIIFKLAYDEKWSKFSPGTLLTMHMIQHVLECDSPDEINFGRGDDGYKKLWMCSRRERWGIEAANPRTPNGLKRALRLLAGNFRDFVMRRRPA
jgi:hypothetical protein